MHLHNDEDLAEAFLKSPTWRRHSRFAPFRRKGGTKELVRSFIRSYEHIPFGATDLPDEFERAVGRVTHLVASKWAAKANETKKADRRSRLIALAERAHRKYLALKQPPRSPELFPELPTQRKPPRNVA